MSVIHIDKHIKEQVKKKKMRVAKLSALLSVSEPNIYKIYQRSSIDTALLERISISLDYNFFEIYYRQYSIESREDKLAFCQRENELLKELLKEKDEKFNILAEQYPTWRNSQK